MNFLICLFIFFASEFGMTENARRENDGPSKSRVMKMQDLKSRMAENDGPLKSWGVKVQDMQMQDVKLQDLKTTDQIAGLRYFVFSVTAEILLGQIVGLLCTSHNLNSNLKHHNYDLKHPCTSSVLRR